jgi:hypothetical protein
MDPAEQEFIAALSLINAPTVSTVDYRLHYDPAGQIYLCTQQQHPTDTTWISVTADQYAQYWLYEVKHNELKLVNRDPGLRNNFHALYAEVPHVPGHAALILETES